MKKMDQIAGYHYQKEEANKIVDFFLNYKTYKARGATLPRGIFFYGNPRNGKTMFAKAIANDSGVPCYSLFEEETKGSVSDTIKNIKSLFAKAKENQPSIIIIDEIDQIVETRKYVSTSDRMKDSLRVLLTEIDDLENSSVLVIATSNIFIDRMPDALVRNGRIEKHIFIGVPKFEDRKAILKLYMEDSVFSEVSIDELANLTSGFSCASLKTLINEVLISSLRNGGTKVKISDFYNPIQVIVNDGIKKEIKDVDLSVCYHEAGHFIVANKLMGEIGTLSVQSFGDNQGMYRRVASKSGDDEEKKITTYEDAEKNICITLGGLAATEVFLGSKHMGARSDLEKAYELIESLSLNGLLGFKELIFAIDDKNHQTHARTNQYTALPDYKIELFEKIYEKTKTILIENKELVVLFANTLKKELYLPVEMVQEILYNSKS